MKCLVGTVKGTMRGLFIVLLMIFIGYVYAQINTLHPHDVDDKLRYNAQNRLLNMTYELIIEAKLLQRQMQPIQSYYQGQITYEIGYVMGKIRDRYKRMIEIYKQAHYMTKHLYLDDKNISQLNTTLALKPGLRMYYPINWVINMEYIRLFEVDIDKLVEVIENIPYYALPDIDISASSIGAAGSVPDPGQGPPGGDPRPRYIAPAYEPGAPGSSVPGPPGTKISRTGGGPGYPPGGVGLLRSESPRDPDEPSPSVHNEPTPIVPNEPSPSVPIEPPPSFPNEPLPILPNEPPPSFLNEPPPNVPNKPPPSVPNKQPPGPPSQLYESTQSQSYDSPPSRSYDSSPFFLNEPPLGLSNEPSPDSARLSYEAPPNQPNEPLQGPPSWPTELPAPSDGKTIRFGSADHSNFRTEDELKRYYREMYRQKHDDGMNDKYENLYK